MFLKQHYPSPKNALNFVREKFINNACQNYSTPKCLLFSQGFRDSFLLDWSGSMYYFTNPKLMQQGMCSGCTNLQIFGASPFAPADFEVQSSLL